MLALPWLTPSTTTPTEATAPAEKVWVPMPRIDPPPPVFWPGACWISSDGRDAVQVVDRVHLLPLELRLAGDGD